MQQYWGQLCDIPVTKYVHTVICNVWLCEQNWTSFVQFQGSALKIMGEVTLSFANPFMDGDFFTDIMIK